MILFIVIGFGAVIAISVILSMLFRVVVPTNEVHIVQSSKKATPYGQGLSDWNVYYKWPAWIPVFGVNSINLAVSIFTITEDNYQAYDQQKVPFGVDIKAFFKVADPVIASQRISSMQELHQQLTDILKGAIRKVLAGKEIITIMETRKEIGDAFTEEVRQQLVSWGVEAVKSIELMDIRDGTGSQVITNIMNRKISLIEKDSRTEIAQNKKMAEIAEIEAKRESDIKRQEAEQLVGQKTAEKQQAIGIANEIATQEIQGQAKITKSIEMEVLKVEQVKSAEIEKEKAIIEAAKQKETDVIKAEGQKLQTEQIAEGAKIKQTLEAEAKLITMTKNAEGIEAEGTANADATSKMEKAKVSGQIELSDKIKESTEYMNYLQIVEAIRAGEKVGVAKAEALKNADLKVVSNSGSVSGGVDNVLDIFSGKGGSSIVSMIENLQSSDVGKELLAKILPKATVKTESKSVQDQSSEIEVTHAKVDENKTNESKNEDKNVGNKKNQKN